VTTITPLPDLAPQIEAAAASFADRNYSRRSGYSDRRWKSQSGNPGTLELECNAQPLDCRGRFPVEVGFETINPNDVESVSVLKMLAAASIWEPDPVTA